MISQKRVNEIEELRETNFSLNENTESSFKTFDMSLDKLQLEDNVSRGVSTKSAIQAIYDVDSIFNFDNKDQVVKDYRTFLKRRRIQSETDN